VLNDQFVSGLRSTYRRDRCLTPEDPASGPGGVLTTTTSCSNNVNASWVVSAIGVEQGATLYALVSMATGLCLEMPGTAGTPVTQQICNGARRQSLQIDELQQTNVLPDGFPLYTAAPINTTAAFGLSTNGMNLHAPEPNGSECLAIISAGAAVEAACDEDHPKFKARVTNPKAGWTHNP
jgi:hypothetical protein